MKIVKHIPFAGEDADLVAFITSGKKPMVFICYDHVFEEYDYAGLIQSAADITDSNELEEYLLKIPLEAVRKIAKVKISPSGRKTRIRKRTK